MFVAATIILMVLSPCLAVVDEDDLRGLAGPGNAEPVDSRRRIHAGGAPQSKRAILTVGKLESTIMLILETWGDSDGLVTILSPQSLDWRTQKRRVIHGTEYS